MPRRLLVIDDDEELCELFRSSLTAYGFEVERAVEEDDWLHRIELSPPEMVVLTVDLPDTLGFSHFSRIKGVAPRVPIVLTTATLSASELSVHEKLTLHADVYLDRRTLTREELFEKLAPFLAEDPDCAAESDLSDPARSSRSASTVDSEWLEELLHDGVDAEIASVLDSLIDSPDLALPEDVEPRASAEPQADPSELQAEVEQLRREVEDARREARSSPFSGDFLSMRAVASSRETEITRLRTEVKDRNRKLMVLKELIDKLRSRLVPLTHERDQARERTAELESRSENSEAETQRARQQSEELRELRDEAIREVTVRLSAQIDEHVRAREMQELALAELECRYAELSERAEADREAALQLLQKQQHQDGAALDREHEKKLSRQEEENQKALAVAIAEERTRGEGALEKTRREHAETLSSLRDEHALEFSRIDDAREEELKRVKKAATEAAEFGRATDEITWKEHVAAIEKQHRDALESLEGRHAAKVAALTSTRDLDRATNEREGHAALEEAIAAERARWEEKLEESRRGHEDTLSTLQKQNEDEQARLKAAHREALATQARESDAAHSRALADVKEHAQKKSEKREHQHAKALSALREMNEQDLASLRANLEETSAANEAKIRANLGASFEQELSHWQQKVREAGEQHQAAVEALGTRHRDELTAVRSEHERVLTAAARSSDEFAEKLIAAQEHASGLEERLQQVMREVLARDEAIEIHQQNLAEQQESIVSFQTLINDLHRTIEDPEGKAGADEAKQRARKRAE